MELKNIELKNKEILNNKLLKFLGKSISAKQSNISIRTIYTLFSIIQIKIEYQEFTTTNSSFKETSEGNFGGAVYYDKNKNKFFIKFFIYKSSSNNLSWEEYIDFIVSKDIYSRTSADFAWTYFHEIMHLFQRHLVYKTQYENVVKKYIQKKSENEQKYLLENISDIINIGQDYYINSLLKNINIFDICYNSPHFIYEKKYNSSFMNEFDILKNMIKNYKIRITEITKGIKYIEIGRNIKNSNGEIEFLVEKDFFKFDEFLQNALSNQISEKNINNTVNDDMTSEINNMIFQLASNESIDIFIKLGLPIKVKIPWIKELGKNIFRESQIRTQKTQLSWGKSNLFNRNFKIPGKKNVNNFAKIYLVVDASGSMDDNDIRKINYIMQEVNNKGNDLIIITHTSKIEEIKEIKGNSKKELEEFIKYRKYNGGTSHTEVFDYLEKEFVKYKSQKHSIVLIISDFYSNIEDIWDKYNWNITSVKKIFVNTTLEPTNKDLRNIIQKNNIDYYTI